ncbi:MAG: 30S ribosomal protein S9 [Chitinivibrionales bacterium]
MKDLYLATGKRKRAIACVRLKPGKGKRIINGAPIKEYVDSEAPIADMERPFTVLEASESYDMIAKVRGGGLSGQMQALRLAAAKALSEVNEDYRIALKSEGLLSRDSRVKERKKYGRKKARKKTQFSKR